jgi:hypothetical protein
MDTDSRDSDTLKPPELDELGQVLATTTTGIEDAEVDRQVEMFPLVVTATEDEVITAFMFASLERVGGTPCVLLGLGGTRPGKQAKKTLAGMAEELYRRAAITFPDEDVLVGGMFGQPSGYSLLDGLSDRVPRAGHKPTGEERAWGRRLAKRFGCEAGYDDRAFQVPGNGRPLAVVDTVSINGAGKRATEAFSEIDAGCALIAFGWALAEALESRQS